MKSMWVVILFWTCQCNKQIANSSSQIIQESGALFEATGYPLIGDIPILNRKMNAVEMRPLRRIRGVSLADRIRNEEIHRMAGTSEEVTIFRGTRVNIREHPYVVSVRRKHSHYLTSTLITKNLILTVAHPLYGVPVHELRIVVGENFSDRGTSLLTVLLVVIHQNFDPYTLAADIAMIRFYEDVTYKTSVRSISLVTPNLPLTDTTGYVTGWGRCDLTEKDLCLPRSTQFNPDEKIDPMLRTVAVTMTLSNLYCEGYEIHNVRIGDGMLCTGTAREENPTVGCLAVPGSPLVVGGKLAGILSWGFGCGYAYDLPLVYTSIQYYTKWIAHNIMILRTISKDNFAPLFQATRAYIIIEWLSNTRILKPILHNHSLYDDIQKIQVDLELAKLQGHLYDIRDFVINEDYHTRKEQMYREILNINETKSNKIDYNKIFIPQ